MLIRKSIINEKILAFNSETEKVVDYQIFKSCLIIALYIELL